MPIDPLNRGHPFLIPELVAAILLAGCASGGSGENAFEDVPVWRLEEVLRTGDVVDPDLGFSRVTSIGAAGDGRIFVLDGQERQVRVFSPEGERLGTIGRQGSGPGEFESPSGLGVLGDTVWVEDFDTRGVTLFSTDGDLLKSVIGPTNALEVGDPPRTVMVPISGWDLREQLFHPTAGRPHSSRRPAEDFQDRQRTVRRASPRTDSSATCASWVAM